jgi:hypothetical protein
VYAGSSRKKSKIPIPNGVSPLYQRVDFYCNCLIRMLIVPTIVCRITSWVAYYTPLGVHPSSGTSASCGKVRVSTPGHASSSLRLCPNLAQLQRRCATSLLAWSLDVGLRCGYGPDGAPQLGINAMKRLVNAQGEAGVVLKELTRPSCRGCCSTGVVLCGISV